MSEKTLGPMYCHEIPSNDIPVGQGMKQAVASTQDLQELLDSELNAKHRIVGAYEVIGDRMLELEACLRRLVTNNGRKDGTAFRYSAFDVFHATQEAVRLLGADVTYDKCSFYVPGSEDQREEEGQ